MWPWKVLYYFLYQDKLLKGYSVCTSTNFLMTIVSCSIGISSILWKKYVIIRWINYITLLEKIEELFFFFFFFLHISVSDTNFHHLNDFLFLLPTNCIEHSPKLLSLISSPQEIFGGYFLCISTPLSVLCYHPHI